MPYIKHPKVRDGILGIDPGSEKTGLCIFRPASYRVEDPCILPNSEVLRYLSMKLTEKRPKTVQVRWVVQELISSYGFSVGRSVFETVRWNGRFTQHLCSIAENNPELRFSVLGVPRFRIKQVVCNSKAKRNDASVIDALKRKFYARHRVPKEFYKPGRRGCGPLKEVKGDAWQALAAAVAFAEQGRSWEHAVYFLKALSRNREKRLLDNQDGPLDLED